MRGYNISYISSGKRKREEHPIKVCVRCFVCSSSALLFRVLFFVFSVIFPLFLLVFFVSWCKNRRRWTSCWRVVATSVAFDYGVVFFSFFFLFSLFLFLFARFAASFVVLFLSKLDGGEECQFPSQDHEKMWSVERERERRKAERRGNEKTDQRMMCCPAKPNVQITPQEETPCWRFAVAIPFFLVWLHLSVLFFSCFFFCFFFLLSFPFLAFSSLQISFSSFDSSFLCFSVLPALLVLCLGLLPFLFLSFPFCLFSTLSSIAFLSLS